MSIPSRQQEGRSLSLQSDRPDLKRMPCRCRTNIQTFKYSNVPGNVAAPVAAAADPTVIMGDARPATPVTVQPVGPAAVKDAASAVARVTGRGAECPGSADD